PPTLPTGTEFPYISYAVFCLKKKKTGMSRSRKYSSILRSVFTVVLWRDGISTPSMCVAGEDQIALFHLLVTGKAGLHYYVVNWLAVTVEVTEPPASRGGVLLRVLDHKLNVRRRPGNERLITSKGFVVFRRRDEAVV